MEKLVSFFGYKIPSQFSEHTSFPPSSNREKTDRVKAHAWGIPFLRKFR